MKPSEITKIKKAKWAELGGKLVTRIVEDADKGISQDPKGNKFPPYKKSYSDLKKAGKATPKGVRANRKVQPANLRLTGEMLNSIKAQRPTAESVEINYRSGLKAEGNANPPKKLKKKRRNIIGLNDKNWGFAKDFIEKEIDDRIIKFYKKKIIIDIDI